MLQGQTTLLPVSKRSLIELRHGWQYPFEKSLFQADAYNKKLFRRDSVAVVSGFFEELFDIADLLREAIGREAFEEDAAVALALDARVEEHEDAAVGE